MALALSSSTTLVLSLRVEKKEIPLRCHMAMECVHIPIAVSTCDFNSHCRDTSQEVHCTSPLELFLQVSKTLLSLFQNHAALLNCIIHRPSIACDWWSIAMSWSRISFLRTDATSSSQMIVTPLRSQVTLAKRFTMPLSPVLMTLS